MAVWGSDGVGQLAALGGGGNVGAVAGEGARVAHRLVNSEQLRWLVCFGDGVQ